jgi:hypothetical protein
MGDLVLKGATSGQITLTPTAVAGTNTLTLPARTGNIITSADSGTVTGTMLASNVAGNGPAFAVYYTGPLSLSASVATKIPFSTSYFNYGSFFDTTTNYRFTPTVAGVYQLSCSAFIAPSTANVALVWLYKNNNLFIEFGRNGSTTGSTIGGSVCVYANGTDYFEFYAFSGGSGNLGSAASPYLVNASGALVRAA